MSGINHTIWSIFHKNFYTSFWVIGYGQRRSWGSSKLHRIWHHVTYMKKKIIEQYSTNLHIVMPYSGNVISWIYHIIRSIYNIIPFYTSLWVEWRRFWTKRNCWDHLVCHAPTTPREKDHLGWCDSSEKCIRIISTILHDIIHNI